MSTVIVTYAGKDFDAKLESAALTYCLATRIAKGTLSYFRLLELDGGQGVTVMLGPACPIAFAPSDRDAFGTEVGNQMPEAMRLFNSGKL